MVAGAVLTFVGGASGRPWCGSAMAIAGWLNLAGHHLEHAHQARSSLPNENLKVGPTPTATFWAGREATIGTTDNFDSGFFWVYSAISHAFFTALWCHSNAVQCALVSEWVLPGACNPMACPFHA